MKTDTKKMLELCEKATPGPWTCPIQDHDGIAADAKLIDLPAGNKALSATWIACVDTENRDDYDPENCFSAQAEDDRQFIAACDPTTVRSLCTELDRARELLRFVDKFGKTYEIANEIRAFLQDDKRGGV